MTTKLSKHCVRRMKHCTECRAETLPLTIGQHHAQPMPN